MKFISNLTFTILTSIVFSLPSYASALAPKEIAAIRQAHVVIEGTVVSKQSYWDQNHKMIYTAHEVEVHGIFKGENISGGMVQIITEGGSVGDEMIKVCPAPNLYLGLTAIFACTEFHSFGSKQFSSEQLTLCGNSAGIIPYNTFSSQAIKEEAAFVREQIATLCLRPVRVLSKASFFQKAGYNSSAQVLMVTGFSPAVASAGTGTVLTISGSGFGAQQLSGKVLFRNTDNGGASINIEPLASQYTLWTDTLIKVIVPSYSANLNGCSSGSGTFLVVNDAGQSDTTATPLTITFNRVNVESGGNAYEPDHVNDNGSGGYSLLMGDSIYSHPGAFYAFHRALETWRCGTGVNFSIPGTTAVSSAGKDGVSTVLLDSLSAFVLGYTYMYYTSCSGIWYMEETDIVLNSNVNWSFSTALPSPTQSDFESTALQLIGFAHQLGHVIDSTDAMYWTSQNGLAIRTLNSNNLAGGTYIMGQSTTANICGPGPMTGASPCGTGLSHDIGMNAIIYPQNGFCTSIQPVKVRFTNFGTAAPLTSATIHWKIDNNGQAPYNWTGNLNRWDTSSVFTIGSYSFSPGTHTITVWASQPNGSADMYAYNDTLLLAISTSTCTTADAGATDYSTPWNSSHCLGSNPVTVSLRNYGTSALNYAEVKWTVNGVSQPVYIWTGTLAGGSASSPFVLGTFNFSNPGAVIRIWTDLPNGINDPNHSNDTTSYTFIPTGLTGVYTIGGASPNYPTLAAAVLDLNNKRICGPVVFNIRPGIYNSPVTLINYLNSSAVNTITIQAENGDSSSVTIMSSAVATITLNGTDYATLQKLTINNTNTTSGSAVGLSSGATHVSILNCVLSGPTNATTNAAVINSSGGTTPNEFFTVKNCSIFNGSNGIALASSSTARATNILVEDNIILNSQAYGISVVWDLPVIRRNYIRTNSTYNQFSGISMYQCNGKFFIQKNKVFINTGNCLRIQQTTCNQNDWAEISNNFLGPENSNTLTAFGVSMDFAWYIHLYNNTILARAQQAFYYTNGTNSPAPCLNLQNNIIANYHPQGIIYYLPSNFVKKFTTNAYYHKGPVFYSGSPNGILLSEWQSLTGQDSGAVMVDPEFIGPLDLHIYPKTVNYQLNGKGIPMAGLTDDIDGNVRSGSPDIGADEFDLPSLDAAAGYPLQTGFCAGTNGVSARVKNYGTALLTSASINWKVNGVLQPPFNWSGNLPQFAVSPVITIGTYSFLPAQNYTVMVWTENPNGSPDLVPQNDTVSFSFVSSGMNGPYTIGGAGPNYATITDARNALAANGVCGPVVFNIRPGTYNEQLSFPQVNGASSYNTITFQSENGDSTGTIISCNASNAATLEMNGADHFIFKNISVLSVSPAVYAIHLKGGANYNTFRQCVLDGRTVVISDKTSRNERNIYLNNKITSAGSYAFSLDGYEYNASGVGWVYEHEKGNEIINNIFYGPYFYGLLISHQAGIKIIGNNLARTYTASSTPAINFSYLYDSVEISKNIVTGVGNGFAFGSFAFSPQNPMKIANNFISTMGSPLYFGDGRNVNILNNSLQADCQTCAVIQTGLQAYSSGGYRLFNNILAAPNGGYALFTGAGIVIASDHNDLFTTGKKMVNYYPGYPWIPDLQSWQNIQGFDMNSYSIKPLFASATDLHLNNDYILSEAGIPITGVTDDIDNDLRNVLTPDIGADEFNLALVPNDAGTLRVLNPYPICSGVAHPVKVILKNFGISNLTSCSINWKVNGTLQTPFNWSGNLASMSVDTVLIASYIFSAPDTFDVMVWTTGPNAGSDTSNTNDTTIFKTIRPALTGAYTIGGSSPHFPSLNYALYELKKNGICGPVTFNIRSGTYNEQLTIPKIAGASAANTITFQSEASDSTQVTISFNATDYFIVKLDGAEHITFRKVKLQNTYTYCAVLQFLNNASYNKFENNIIEGKVSGPGNEEYLSIIRSVSGLNQGNIFRSNVVRYGAYGFWWNLSGSGTVIEGNELTGQNLHSICVSNQYGLLIRNNRFSNTTVSSSYNFSAIYATGCTGNTRIEKNTITGNFNHSGIYLSSCTGGTTSNNMISMTPQGGEGIYSHFTSNWNFYFNSVRVASTYTPAATFHANAGSGLKLSNNIFMNAGGGLAYYVTSSAPIDSSDYNDFYSTGPTLAKWWNTNVSSLTSLQAASGMESNSLNADPNFISSTDLHISNPALDGAGIPIAGITDDIDGDIRSTSAPDIGADETTLPPVHADDELYYSGCRLYPNPLSVQTIFEIEASLNTGEPVILSVYNAFGQMVREVQLHSNRLIFQRGGLENGIYFFRATSDGKVMASGKMLIQ